MISFDLDQRLNDLIAFQCVLVELRGIGADASEEMLWHTLAAALVEQFGFRRAWYGRCVGPSLHPAVSFPMDDLPVKIDAASPLVRNAHLSLPVTVDGCEEGALVIEADDCASEDRARQIRILAAEAVSMIEERRSRWSTAQALREAKLHAESADRAKSLMLANMSHEIRTPMTGVIGFADLLAGTPLNPDQRDYLGHIRSSAQSLLTLINDILDFSKSEAGKLELASEPVDLRDLIEKVVGLLAVRAAEKHLLLSFSIAPSAPAAILSDGVRLRQVLVNLLGNAVKFTAKGEVALSVSGSLEPDGSRRVSFAVSDTGPGIAPEHQDRIFESFSQVDSSISRNFGGTGLGLAISRSIVKQMAGALSVESVPGSGATFRFWIPAQVVSVTRPAVPQQPAFDRAQYAALPPLKLLVAEDNPVNRKLILAVLKQLGLEADSATNGLEAVERAIDRSYDVVLMDVQMPGVDGLEATRRISRQCPPDRRPRVIAMTAAAFPEDRTRCMEAGMDDYVSKPVNVEELVAALRRTAPQPALTQ
jgi:signal transduction histidine kinase/ActR/RegA family two-component response regulator